jgi:hypothetical protein
MAKLNVKSSGVEAIELQRESNSVSFVKLKNNRVGLKFAAPERAQRIRTFTKEEAILLVEGLNTAIKNWLK